MNIPIIKACILKKTKHFYPVTTKRKNIFSNKSVVLLAALFSMLVFSGCTPSEREKLATAFDTAPMQLNETSSAPVIEFVSEQDSSSDFKYTIEYPVISGLADEALENKLNSSIKARVIDHVSTIKSYSKQSPQLRGSVSYEAYAKFDIKYSSPEFISMIGILGEYTGGAHGTYSAVVYNFDVASGKNIELGSLFMDDFDYKKSINTEITSQIKKSPSDIMYFEQKELRFQSISERQMYFIKDGKLNIQFGLYEIAPYATGMPSFEIPSELINDHIKPQYRQLFN